MIFETGKTVILNTAENAIIALEGNYTVVPTVVLSLKDEDINAYITSISKTQFTVYLSRTPATSVTVNYTVIGI
jgi:hypothetical protein